MKKHLLLFLLWLPMAIYAQVDKKYLEGAVPVVDGKVTFSQELNAKGLTKDQLYTSLLDWANKYFKPKENTTPLVLYTNKETGQIIVGGDDYIVFSSSYIVKDVSHIYYHFIINCDDNRCNLVMTRIHYLYEESRSDGGYKYKAEEWITDKHGLTKSKDKLARISGKFRRETIDYKDKLFGEVQAFLNNQIVNALSETPSTVSTPAKDVAVKKEMPVQTAPETKAAVVSVAPVAAAIEQPAAKEPAPAPSNQEELIAKASRMTITAGNDEQFEISKDSWGGFGEMFGQKVVFCFIESSKKMGNLLMSQAEDYTISFFNENSNKPCLVIKCLKMGQQELKGKSAKNLNPNCEEGKSYNMYIGAVQK